MASAKLPLKLLQGWIFGRKLQNVVHQSALRHTHDNLHDVGRSLISSGHRIHGWLNKLKVDMVNPLCCLTIPGAVGLHSKEVVQYQFQITLKPTVAIQLFRLISFLRRFTSFHLFRLATCRQMFEIPPRLHQRGNM